MRTAIATLLTILLVPALVAANLSTWSARTVVDGRAFTTTIARSLDTPAVDALVADAVATVVVRSLARASATERLAGVLALGLPVDADEAAVRERVDRVVLTALDDPEVQATRDRAIEAVHGVLIGAARGNGDVVRIDGRDVVIDIFPIVEQAARSIDTRFVAVVRDRLDPATTRVVVASSDGIQVVSTTVVVLDTLRWVVPLLVVAACLLIVVVAHRRVRALAGVGVAVMIAGLISIGLVWVGGVAAPAAADDPTLQQVASEVYGALTAALVIQSMVLVLTGAAIAVTGWALLRRRRTRVTTMRSGRP